MSTQVMHTSCSVYTLSKKVHIPSTRKNVISSKKVSFIPKTYTYTRGTCAYGMHIFHVIFFLKKIKKICALHKNGGVAMTRETILGCARLAAVKVEEIHNVLEKALEGADAKAALERQVCEPRQQLHNQSIDRPTVQ